MRTLLIPSTLLLLLPLACILPGADDDDGNDGNDDAAGTTDASPTSGSSPNDDGGSMTPGESGMDETNGNVDETGPDETEGGGGAFHCTNASLLAGDPYFNGDFGDWEPDGQPLVGDPPLRMRHVAAIDDHVAIDTQFEIWLSDGDTVHRIAGDENEVETQYQPSGACADVRVITAEGIAALPNGNLVVADTKGNGLIELSDPLGNCTAAPIAGNPDAIEDVDIFEDVAAPGDIDGPGTMARFHGVSRPVTDADGNIYVNDQGNTKLKRIANDADRTVSTIIDYGSEDEPLIYAMTELDGFLYVTAGTVVDDILWKIDLSNNELTTLFQGRGQFDEIDSSSSAGLLGLTNDGVDLYAVAQKGFLFRISTSDGKSQGAVAGMGPIVDYPEGIDLTMPVALDMLPLRSYGINEADLIRMGDDIVFTGNANGVGFHLWSIHCG